MKTTPPRTPRGFTLIELMVSTVVMMAAILAASAVMIAVASFFRNTQNMADNYDGARLAGDALSKSLRSAGIYTGNGLYVNAPSGTGTLIYPVYGTSGGATAPDELWILEPDKAVFGEACKDKGAALPVTLDSTSPTLSVSCPATYSTFDTTDFVVAANLRTSTGALLTPPLVLTNTTVKSSEPATFGIGSPTYKAGDVVLYRVVPWHYFIATESATGRPALMRHRAVLGTSAAAPLVNDPNTADEVVQSLIEDLQVTYSTAPITEFNPANYTEQNTLAPGVTAGTSLRSVRITVVAVSKQTKQKGSGGTSTSSGVNLSYGPSAAEDHTTVGVNDGYQRGRFIRRLELPNMAPVIL